MIEINLLPPHQIKAREEKKYFRKIIVSFLLLFIILFISFGLFFVLKNTLALYLNSQKDELFSLDNYLNQEKNKKVQQDIENINKILSRISIIEKNKTIWSETLFELVKITPNDLSFVNLKISDEDEKIEIMGLAKTRESLLIFQDNLEKSKYFENVTSPISNIISPTDINFSIEAKLTPFHIL
ncbi:MAG: PilN domain-containing protein [Patescibacteria group bacterium]